MEPDPVYIDEQCRILRRPSSARSFWKERRRSSLRHAPAGNLMSRDHGFPATGIKDGCKPARLQSGRTPGGSRVATRTVPGLSRAPRSHARYQVAGNVVSSVDINRSSPRDPNSFLGDNAVVLARSEPEDRHLHAIDACDVHRHAVEQTSRRWRPSVDVATMV